MVKELRHIDVSSNPELMRLAEEVAESGDSIVLTKGKKDLATITPAAPGRKRLQARELSPEDLEAFWSSAGSWADVDVDEFMKYVYEGRQSSKPPVDL